MPTFTSAERSRLFLKSATKGNPQAIMVLLDHLKQAADEALQGTLDTAKRQAFTKLEAAIQDVRNHYAASLEQDLESIRSFIKQEVSKIQPPKGAKGDKGDTPSDDYLLSLIEPLIPYVKPGSDGKTPGKDELIAIMKPLIVEMTQKEDTAEEAKDEKEEEKRLAAIVEKMVAQKITEVKRFGGGGSGDRVKAGTGVTITTNTIGQKVITASGSFSILTATGTVNDSNTTFTFASEPTILYVNGQALRKDHGWTWTVGTLTATLDNPVGTGGDIYGIV